MLEYLLAQVFGVWLRIQCMLLALLTPENELFEARDTLMMYRARCGRQVFTHLMGVDPGAPGSGGTAMAEYAVSPSGRFKLKKMTMGREVIQPDEQMQREIQAAVQRQTAVQMERRIDEALTGDVGGSEDMPGGTVGFLNRTGSFDD